MNMITPYALVLLVLVVQTLLVPSTLAVTAEQDSGEASRAMSIFPHAGDQLKVLARSLEEQGCVAEDYIGTTIVQADGGNNYCYIVELKEGGVFGRDPSSSNDCSSVHFVPSQEFSVFDRVDGSRVHFRAGQMGWTGYFDIVLDETVTELHLAIHKFDPEIREFEITFKYSSCNAPTGSPTKHHAI